jgi:4-alpha-glucanotransferase
MTLFPRSSGILLHPTSLPGPYGMGDLGEQAFRFVDWLADLGQSVWQILPLGPTGYADSPYQTLSAFAGNTSLISLDGLVGRGWLQVGDLDDVPAFPADRVDYGHVIPYHEEKLALAFEHFTAGASAADRAAFGAWCAEQSFWLDDFALFVALKRAHGLRPWVEWEKPLALRDPAALAAFAAGNQNEISAIRWGQWIFFSQWGALLEYAHSRGIRLFGDIPIFVAHDSADVWADREAYYLEPDGNPSVIAGVPPDYFSPTGQRWGNPLYRWDVMQARGYAWWIRRFKAILSLVDYVRVDHFRGFAAYWEIPASEDTAINGQWVPGPGGDFFEGIVAELGQLPIIAEDLGVITEDVEQLRDMYALPGMKVLQFAWSDPTNPFLPHNHPTNCIVYSGTHDNNTTQGWWDHEVDTGTINFIQEYLGKKVTDPVYTMLQAGMASSAHTFIMPLQDVFKLGKACRMNTPGKPEGNWTWRVTTGMLADEAARHQIGHMTWLYQRRPDQQERAYGDVAERKSTEA